MKRQPWAWPQHPADISPVCLPSHAVWFCVWPRDFPQTAVLTTATTLAVTSFFFLARLMKSKSRRASLSWFTCSNELACFASVLSFPFKTEGCDARMWAPWSGPRWARLVEQHGERWLRDNGLPSLPVSHEENCCQTCATDSLWGCAIGPGMCISRKKGKVWPFVGGLRVNSCDMSSISLRLGGRKKKLYIIQKYTLPAFSNNVSRACQWTPHKWANPLLLLLCFSGGLCKNTHLVMSQKAHSTNT